MRYLLNRWTEVFTGLLLAGSEVRLLHSRGARPFAAFKVGSKVGVGLVFSAYLGGSRNNLTRHITTDQEGNIYITGGTASPDYSGMTRHV